MFSRLTALNSIDFIENLKSGIVRDPLTVSPDTPVMDAIAQMLSVRAGRIPPGDSPDHPPQTAGSHSDELCRAARASCVLVVEAGQLVGILTEQDVVRLSAQQQPLDRLVIGQVMSHPVITLHEADCKDLFFILDLLQQHHIHHLPILDEQDRLVGLVTPESLRQIFRPADLLRLRLVEEAMTHQVICAGPDCSVLEIAQRMVNHRVSSVVIVDPLDGPTNSPIGKPTDAPAPQMPVGILTKRNLVELQASGLKLGNCAARTVMSAPILAIKPEASLWAALQLMEQHGTRRVVVTGSHGEVLGIVTQTSVLQLLNPLELYKLAGLLKDKVLQLEAEKAARLERRTVEAEARLRESEQRYATLIAAVPVGIFRTDAAGQCIYVNEHWCQITGLTPAESFGEGWQQGLYPDDRDRLTTQWAQFVQGNNPFQVEYRLQRPDGKVTWVYGQSVAEHDAHGQVAGYVGTVTDISDRKRSEEALRQSEAHQRALISAIPDLITRVSRDGICLEFASTPNFHMVGGGPADFVGAHVSESLPPKAAQQRMVSIQRVLQTHSVQIYEQDLSVDGTTQIEEVRIVPYGQDDVLILVRDISDRKQAEDRLRESEAHSRAILAAIPDYLFRVGADGIYRELVTHNRGRDLLPTDLNPVGLAMVDVLPADIATRHQHYLEQALNTGELQVYEQQVQVGERLQDEEIRVVQSGDDEVLFMLRDISDRKRAQTEQLRADHIRQELTILEQILDTVLAGYWDWDIPNHLEYLSPGFKRMFGYADHELPNTPESWQNLIFPEDLPFVLDCFDRHVQSRGDIPYCSEVRYRHKDGSTVWVICSGQVIEWDAAGKPLRMIGCHIDISNLKQAEAKLQTSQAFYQSIIADQTELICRFLPDGTLTFVNDAYCHFFQKSPEELLGHSFTPLLPEADQDIPLQSFSSLSVENPVVTYEHRVIAPNGHIHWQQWTDRALFAPDGTVTEFQAVGHDITPLKAAAAALRESEARWQFALEGSGDGVWDWNTQTNTVFFSRQWKAMLGHTEDEVGNGLDEWDSRVHPEDKARCYADLNKHFSGETPIYQNEHRVRCKDGSYKWILDRGKVIKWTADGQPLRVIGTHTDISDRKQAEEQIRRYTAQLEASNQELEAFAYSVSHDLRAPLRAIDGFSQALLEDYGDTFDDEGKDFFDRIRKNVTRMGTLIDDLLRLSQVSRAEICYTTVNLSALAQELMHDLQASESERSVEVAIAPDASVSADATLMRVVLTNLLENAWKFTRHHPTARIEFGVINQIEQMTYFIRDDGAGFDMTYAKMLFGVFQRLHSTHEFPGTGIGLATVQRAIHRHGGRIWAEATVEQGATFYFTIPSTPLELGV